MQVGAAHYLTVKSAEVNEARAGQVPHVSVVNAQDEV